MSKASVYEAKTESFIQPILDSMNFELVDVEYVNEDIVSKPGDSNRNVQFRTGKAFCKVRNIFKLPCFLRNKDNHCLTKCNHFRQMSHLAFLQTAPGNTDS